MLQKASFFNQDIKDKSKNRIEVQFNPADLNFNKTAQFAEIAIPGLDAPVLQFVRGGTQTLTVELFFDTSESGSGPLLKSVKDLTDAFYKLVLQDYDTHAPPVCRFEWGQQNAFVCVVESIDRKFLLFSPDGVPLRARLTVKMREYQTVKDMVAKLGSADHTKARVLKRRERLDQISSREYETPAEWRRIADENQIENPRRIVPGTVLKIPPMRLDSVTGRKS
jgi:hypothetical protein